MADNDKAEAANLPRIGEMIDASTGGRVKYDSYSGDQKLGRTEGKPYTGVEAAAAAIINHPEIEQKVYTQLEEQAFMRMGAVADDMKKILHGEKLEGLPAAPIVNGKVKMGVLFMSDAPTREDVIAQDQAHPEKLAGDLAKLAKAEEILKNPEWRISESLSNLTNFVRDGEIELNGHSFTQQQGKTISLGMKAAQDLERALLKHDALQTPLSARERHRLEGDRKKVEAARDTEAAIAGIKPDDPTYQHYRQAMDKGIESGIEAAAAALRKAGVQETSQASGMATYAPAATKEPGGKTPE